MGALLCCAAGAGERQGDACPTRVGQARRRIVEALSTHRLACPTRVGQDKRCAVAEQLAAIAKQGDAFVLRPSPFALRPLGGIFFYCKPLREAPPFIIFAVPKAQKALRTLRTLRTLETLRTLKKKRTKRKRHAGAHHPPLGQLPQTAFLPEDGGHLRNDLSLCPPLSGKG